tara:strand:+ start:57 stop:674 length:618 start_codon:yes stop_codon:yes gene_type:complete
MTDLVLIGGGRFSTEVAEVAIQNGFNLVGYIDRVETSSNLSYLGLPDEFLSKADESLSIFPAFGALDRKSILARTKSLHALKKFKVPSLVSEYSYISDTVKLGRGSFVSHGVVINPDANIGEYSIINSGSTIGHDVFLSDFSIISGNVFLGGGCKIGENSLIGPGVTVLQNINIGSEVIVSVGSTIGRNIPNGKTTLPVLSRVVN